MIRPQAAQSLRESTPLGDSSAKPVAAGGPSARQGAWFSAISEPERFAVEAAGGRIEFVGDEKTHSSSALREMLRQRGAL